jgi:hypothetical protein
MSGPPTIRATKTWNDGVVSTQIWYGPHMEATMIHADEGDFCIIGGLAVPFRGTLELEAL